jgi:hypothetical protein
LERFWERVVAGGGATIGMVFTEKHVLSAKVIVPKRKTIQCTEFFRSLVGPTATRKKLRIYLLFRDLENWSCLFLTLRAVPV